MECSPLSFTMEMALHSYSQEHGWIPYFTQKEKKAGGEIRRNQFAKIDEHFRKSHREKMHHREKMCTKRRFP